MLSSAVLLGLKAESDDRVVQTDSSQWIPTLLRTMMEKLCKQTDELLPMLPGPQRSFFFLDIVTTLKTATYCNLWPTPIVHLVYFFSRAEAPKMRQVLLVNLSRLTWHTSVPIGEVQHASDSKCANVMVAIPCNVVHSELQRLIVCERTHSV